ncbi:14815_t:CDS:2 [Gigaspora rosea]|nr:14815_t:CDS:2 [Gigaspora rosea]
MDFEDIMEPENIIDSEDIMDFENIESDILDPNKDFISSPKNVARKKAMANHIINSCRKISAENKILYSQIIKNKSEQVTESSMHKAVLMTDHFDKATMSSEKVVKMCNLTLSLDEWTDVSNNSIYTFLLYKFEDVNEIINIEDFSKS